MKMIWDDLAGIIDKMTEICSLMQTQMVTLSLVIKYLLYLQQGQKNIKLVLPYTNVSLWRLVFWSESAVHCLLK